MVESINSWIKQGSNYALGISLYDQHGDSDFYKLLFKKGETPFNRKKLNELLVELRDKAPIPAPSPEPVRPVVKTLPVQKPSAPAEQPVPATKNLPELLKVKQQRKQSYAEIQQLHPYLSITPEGEDLRVVAETIVRAGKLNTELWARYNFLTENPDAAGERMPPPPPPVMIDLLLLAKRELLRKSINKAENRIKGEAKPKQKTLDLIAKRKLELKALDDHIVALKREAGI